MRAPMIEVRRTELAHPEKALEGLDALAHRAQGKWRRRRAYQRGLWEEAGLIEAAAAALRELSAGEMRARLATHRAELRRYGTRWREVFPAVLPALVEMTHRILGLRPYRVQIMGALGLAHGRLVEMATGEGKTLTIALAAVPAGWFGRPCHIITANDYLAERDATELAALYLACGLRVAHTAAAMAPDERRAAYAADIVYTTSKELVADFLRDRLLLGSLAEPGRRTVERFLKPDAPQPPLVLRGLHTAIVDEADNQMIAEAVTPLIISRRQDDPKLIAACRRADQVAATLLSGEDYEVDFAFKEIRLIPAGRAKVAAWCAERGEGGFFRPVWMATLVAQALQARHFFLRDKQYVIMDGEVVIVDEFTGRLMPGRSWRLGLHQAVEAKEGVPITQSTESLAQLSFQRFYPLFRQLAGITGTAAEAAGEFWRVYALPLVVIPPHRPRRRDEWPARYFTSAGAKWAAIVEQIAEVHGRGRPVLVGTRSVAASEHLGRLLEARGFAFAILNAVRHREEAAIVRQAGEPHAITIATNMAGRGTDIRLGPGVAASGGLHVILTERHESRRIDRQLQGRAGRQGDPGSTCTFAGLEDELAERFMPAWQRRAVASALRGGSPVALKLARWAFDRAQHRADREAYRQRCAAMAHDRQLVEALTAGNSIDRL